MLLAGMLLVSCHFRSNEPRSAKKAATNMEGPEWEEKMAYADSVSRITGIPWGSPYYYDPSWEIRFSEKRDTLYYFPCEDTLKSFAIPPTVRVIDERAFQCNQNLEGIVIPRSVNEIGLGAFIACHELRYVVILGPVKNIEWRCFDGCSELRHVDLPASVESVGDMSFFGCDKLNSVIIRNPEPPRMLLAFYENGEEEGMFAFKGVSQTECVLYVPKGSVKKYRKADGWNYFKNIQEL